MSGEGACRCPGTIDIGEQGSADDHPRQGTPQRYLLQQAKLGQQYSVATVAVHVFSTVLGRLAYAFYCA